MKLVTVKTTGRRYLYNGERRDIVAVKGEVRSLSGFSATHGPDKKFKRDTVWVSEVDLSEQLLGELYEQSDIKDPPPPPPPPEEPKWVEWSIEDGRHRAHLTEYADEQLQVEGYSFAMDQLGNGLDEDMLQTAACDCAADHMELTREGVRPGYGLCREAAADMIYDGMLKALDECKAKGRKVSTDR